MISRAHPPNHLPAHRPAHVPTAELSATACFVRQGGDSPPDTLATAALATAALATAVLGDILATTAALAANDDVGLERRRRRGRQWWRERRRQRGRQW